MPLLLLLPLLVVALALLWLLLLPFALWQRYRMGRARRRALPWVTALNVGSLLLSSLVFLGTAAIAAHWVAGAFVYAVGGIGLGALLAVLGVWLTRFEHTT